MPNRNARSEVLSRTTITSLTRAEVWLALTFTMPSRSQRQEGYN